MPFLSVILYDGICRKGRHIFQLESELQLARPPCFMFPHIENLELYL